MPDFNRNGFNDIVLRNYKTGDNVIWSMGGTNGTTVVGGLPLPNVPQPAYRLELTGDFNADNQADLLFRNYETGENLIWLMNDNNIIGGAVLPPLPDEAWQPRVAGDFTGDNKTDIVFRNTATGENIIWVMDGTTLTGGIALPPLSTEWRLSVGGDVDRNGTGDLFWRNSLTGDNVIWRMNRSTVLGGVALPRVPEAEWRIEGADDFDRNGFADFRWRNYKTGDNLVWLMDGANIISGAVLPPLAANSGWESPSGSFDNLVLGTSANDVLSGASGNDSMLGRAANDFISGASGNDTLQGEAGHDMMFGSTEHDYLAGGDGNDILYGEVGNDILIGGRNFGAGTFVIAAYKDTLTGGVGSDTFGLRIAAATSAPPPEPGEPIGFDPAPPADPNTADLITDFQDGIDRLVLPQGIAFEQLTFSPAGAFGESTFIHSQEFGAFGLPVSDRAIAVLTNVAPSQLTALDFVAAPPGGFEVL
jgi:Ca2+-binding RTX toxin-like protein